MVVWLRFGLAVLLLCRMGAAWAHDSRPAYLEISEIGTVEQEPQKEGNQLHTILAPKAKRN